MLGIETYQITDSVIWGQTLILFRLHFCHALPVLFAMAEYWALSADCLYAYVPQLWAWPSIC